MEFFGYPRSDGKAGTRNLVAIIPAVFCANKVVQRIADSVQGAVAFPHPSGCGYPGPDMPLTAQILTQIARHPNFGAVLFVGLGCERVRSEDMAQSASVSGKPMACITIQEEGDSSKTVATGIRIVQDWIKDLSARKREKVDAEGLVLGLKCGGTDAASGIAANPVLGAASDLLIQSGGTSILTEVTELIHTEHIMARRAKDARTAQAIIDTVRKNEERLRRMLRATARDSHAHDLVSVGNVDGGVSNVVEKALGGVKKSGKAPFSGVVQYGERPEEKGLFLMDGPGHDAEAVTGLICGGANVVVFTTGRGTPTGFPGIPVIKMTGNPETWAKMEANLDFNAGEIFTLRKTPEELGKKLMEHILAVASGELTRAEQLGHEELFVVSRFMSTHRYFECC